MKLKFSVLGVAFIALFAVIHNIVFHADLLLSYSGHVKCRFIMDFRKKNNN